MSLTDSPTFVAGLLHQTTVLLNVEVACYVGQPVRVRFSYPGNGLPDMLSIDGRLVRV
jgi:hypothetical protein